jgi:AraC-like DNA-binding protein
LQVRAAALTGFADVARSLGLDPDDLLYRTGLATALDAEDDDMVDATAVADLLELAASMSGCMGFGLLMAEHRSLARLGPLSLLLEHEALPRDRIEAIVNYQGLFGDALAINATEADDLLMVSMELRSPRYRRQGVELMIGAFYRALVEAAAGGWQPECVHFVHAAPENLSVHRRFFSCPVAFDSTFNGFSCAGITLAGRGRGGLPVLADHARRIVDTHHGDGSDRDLALEIRRALNLLLPLGRATLEEVGRELGLHPRALQRRLAREGKSFATLLNAMRREVAQRHLSNRDLPIATVGAMAGFDAPSSFSRWFQLEYGQSPRRWRAATGSD